MELLQYNPETGIFTRNMQTSNRVKVGDIAGSLNNQGYIQIRLLGMHNQAHRLAWLIMTGEWPKEQIDHINGVRDDNRWCNLREVSNQENHHNRIKPKNNTSGVMGVYWDKQKCKWGARININGDRINLGWFASFDEAKVTRKAAELEYGFHPNHGEDMK